MKKLLFINGHMNCGGVEKALLEILRHMDYSRFDVDLLLLEEIGDYAEEIPPQVNVRLMSLKNTYGSWWKCLLSCAIHLDWFSFRMRAVFLFSRFFGLPKMKLAKKVLDLPYYDTVVAFRSGICSQIAAYAVDAGKKVTWWHHGEIVIDKENYAQSAKEFDHIVVVSSSCMKMLAEAFPTLREKMTVIPNMVDTVAIEAMASEEAEPQRRRPEKGALQIVTVCRIAPEKHVENILPAATEIKNNGIHFRWIIVGDGDDRPKLEKEAEERGLKNELYFAGALKNPYPLLKCADLYVHPSYIESQGISILEALSLQIPCVVTESLGPKEYLVNNKNAVVVACGSDALADGVLRLLKDKELYASIQRNSFCPQDYLPEKVMDKIAQIV